jgi:hypothetical protein
VNSSVSPTGVEPVTFGSGGTQRGKPKWPKTLGIDAILDKKDLFAMACTMNYENAGFFGVSAAERGIFRACRPVSRTADRGAAKALVI